MKKKELAGITEILSGFIQAGAASEQIMKALANQYGDQKRFKDFVMISRSVRAWIESEKDEVKLTNSEKAVILTLLPFIGWNNQIELLQSDMQRVCGYKDRNHFRQLLNSLAKKNILHKIEVGRQNYWSFNSFIARRGNDEGEQKYIKFNLPKQPK